jgi:hypothetical protein
MQYRNPSFRNRTSECRVEDENAHRKSNRATACPFDSGNYKRDNNPNYNDDHEPFDPRETSERPTAVLNARHMNIIEHKSILDFVCQLMHKRQVKSHLNDYS